eukprot:5062727-Pyramimonas_sp.AAC.1
MPSLTNQCGSGGELAIPVSTLVRQSGMTPSGVQNEVGVPHLANAAEKQRVVNDGLATACD